MSQQALLVLPLQGWSLSQHGERHSHHNFRWEDCGSLGWGKPMIKCWAWIEKVTTFTAENGVQETIYSGPETYLPCSVTHWIHPLQSKSGYICEISCGVTAPFSWSWCAQDFVCALQGSVSPVLYKFWQFYCGVNGDLFQEGLCHTQVRSTQSPYPCSSPLLTHNSTGDTQTLKGRSGSVSVRSGAHKVLFELSERLWRVWGLILNAISPFLPSCWGFSFALGSGVYIFGGIQHSPVDGCSAASCNFEVLTEDECTFFYSTISFSRKVWPRLACECAGVSGGGEGQWWPGAGPGALSAPVKAWDLLKDIPIIFITSTIVWPQVKQQRGNTALPINKKIGLKIYRAWPHPSELHPAPPSQAVPSGSFHKPLILLHQRADRRKTTITEN